MCMDGMWQNGVRHKKPMASSEGSALVAMTASAVREAPPLTFPKGREFILGMFKAFRQNSFPLGDTGMAPSGISYIHAHEQHIPHDEHHVCSGNSYIHAHEHYTIHDKTHVSSGNSVGVAIPQPRVAGEARYPG